MALSTGTRLGPYEITALLGAGGMGEVYQARDTRLERDVAIKVLHPSSSADPDRLRRFEQEARSAGMLNHPNILAIYDVGSHEGAPYVVSELLEGESLRQRLGGTALSARKITDWAVQIAHGMAAAHEKGIVHRDLKPENLFITNDGHVKILDFGLAKLVVPDGTETETTINPPQTETVAVATDPGKVMGTVGYMSPEQVRGKPVDHRSDIFSFGAILYEMLSGQRAFRGDTAADTMTAILREEPPELSDAGRDTPPGVERIIQHCLEKVPEERFQSARDLAFNLEAISGDTGAGVAAVPEPRARSGGLSLRIIGVVLAAIVGLAAGYILWARTALPPPPEYHRLTFRRGMIGSVRFGPDGQTVVYSASWDGNPSQLFLKRPESPDALPLNLPRAGILDVSSTGEMAILLDPQRSLGTFLYDGTLARVAMTGGTPREIAEGIQQADWTPDGTDLVVVRAAEGVRRLEFPLGTVLYETTGAISSPQFSPSGERIAFLHHPLPSDDRGLLVIVDLEGRIQLETEPWRSVRGLAWTPSEDEVWLTASQQGGASRVLIGLTLEGRERVVTRTPGGLRLHDISASGDALLSRDDWRVGILALVSGETEERDLSWLEHSIAADLSDDGKSMLFTAQGEAFGFDYAVCLRKTDGSPPVRLGDGDAFSLSPDGQWAISKRPTPEAPLVLYPTGPGEPRTLAIEGIHPLRAIWFPDGKRILIAGLEKDRGVRLYVQGIDEETPRSITAEGVMTDAYECGCISPDGRWVAAIAPDREVRLYAVDGRESRAIVGAEAGDMPICWSTDGHWLFLEQRRQLSCRIFRLDLETGHRELWRELHPDDPTGLVFGGMAVITPDGESYAYTFGRILSELYMVEGLR